MLSSVTIAYFCVEEGGEGRLAPSLTCYPLQCCVGPICCSGARSSNWVIVMKAENIKVERFLVSNSQYHFPLMKLNLRSKMAKKKNCNKYTKFLYSLYISEN